VLDNLHAERCVLTDIMTGGDSEAGLLLPAPPATPGWRNGVHVDAQRRFDFAPPGRQVQRMRVDEPKQRLQMKRKSSPLELSSLECFTAFLLNRPLDLQSIGCDTQSSNAWKVPQTE